MFVVDSKALGIAMAAARLSEEDMARRTSMLPSTIKLFLASDRRVGEMAVFRLSEALGVNPLSIIVSKEVVT